MRFTSRCLAVLCVVLMPALGAACSSGPGSSSAVVATGGVTCSKVGGTIDFSPPLTATGTTPENAAINLTVSGCTTSGSNVSQIQSGAVTATLSTANNACAGLLMSKPVNVDVTWAPASVHHSAVKLSGYTIGVSPSNGGGFILPNKGGTVHVSGSFAGSDNGASSNAAIYSSQSAEQLIGACGSSTGLASITASSGHIKLQ